MSVPAASPLHRLRGALNKSTSRALPVVGLFGLVAVIMTGGLSSVGIWEPWELAAGDLGRSWFRGGDATAADAPAAAPWLIAGAFRLFGTHDWSGRLPIALCGLLFAGTVFHLVRSFAGRREALYSAWVVSTTPLVLFNARHMFGAAPAFLASALVFSLSLRLVQPAIEATSIKARALQRAGTAVCLLLSIAFAVHAAGVLLGVAPPLLGTALAVLARPRFFRTVPRIQRITEVAVVGAALGLAALAATFLWVDRAGYSMWTGGQPVGGSPPGWEVGLTSVFHAFAPWSAALPLALVALLRPYRVRASSPRPPLSAASESGLVVGGPALASFRIGLVGWASFGFLAHVLYTARLGPAVYLPVGALSAAVGLWLADVERGAARKRDAIIVLFLVGLVVRDFRDPNRILHGLGLDQPTLPEGFQPSAALAILLVAFGLSLAAAMSVDVDGGRLALRAEVNRIRSARRPLRALVYPKTLLTFLRAQRARGSVFSAALAGALLLIGLVLGFGVLCWVSPSTLTEWTQSSLVARVGQMAFVAVVLVLFVAAYAGRWAAMLWAASGRWRMALPVLVTGATAAYVCVFLAPDLGRQFSNRAAYRTYRRLAVEGEPLGEYGAHSRAAAYYDTGPVEALPTQQALVAFLSAPARRWATFARDDLPSIDRAFRLVSGEHLFVVDIGSVRRALVANHAVPGLPNQNPLAARVLKTAPKPQHELRATFDRRIELLGYDLELPQADSVGPSQTFGLTWYFRSVAPVRGAYQVFVHINGPGQYINGDHIPVDGIYPVSLWEPGDVIVDRHRMRVPANYRRSTLTMYVGFFAGERRLPVTEGPQDGNNRVRAGVLHVR